jgi:hypothetical protein
VVFTDAGVRVVGQGQLGLEPSIEHKDVGTPANCDFVVSSHPALKTISIINPKQTIDRSNLDFFSFMFIDFSRVLRRPQVFDKTHQRSSTW